MPISTRKDFFIIQEMKDFCKMYPQIPLEVLLTPWLYHYRKERVRLIAGCFCLLMQKEGKIPIELKYFCDEQFRNRISSLREEVEKNPFFTSP